MLQDRAISIQHTLFIIFVPRSLLYTPFSQPREVGKKGLLDSELLNNKKIIRLSFLPFEREQYWVSERTRNNLRIHRAQQTDFV